VPWDLKPLNGRGWILSDYSSGKREPSCASSTLVKWVQVWKKEKHKHFCGCFGVIGCSYRVLNHLLGQFQKNQYLD